MAKSSDGDIGSFDLDRFRKLLQLMEKYGVTETQLTKDGESWKVRRGPKYAAAVPSVAAPVPVGAPVQAPAVASTPAAGPSAAPAAKTINAPTVGTFYAAPNPDDPPFVSVGSTVEAKTIVCTIEAMKVFNEIPAEMTGTIVEVLVENGDPVEYGQPLFRVE
jgi:acetyl-CoA carboxylase biotin carboxyl carrier protein